MSGTEKEGMKENRTSKRVQILGLNVQRKSHGHIRKIVRKGCKVVGCV
jgi:hypothetical protein